MQTIRHLTDAGTSVQVGISIAGRMRGSPPRAPSSGAPPPTTATHPEVATLIGLAISYEQTGAASGPSSSPQQEPPR
jgi:hypothetical protein